MKLKSNMAEEVYMYLHRAVEKTILKAELQTKAILITGARQVGKSTTISDKFWKRRDLISVSLNA